MLGDYNLSYNDPTHRLLPDTASAHIQHDALCSLLTQGGLTDVCDLPHTWASSTTWSSPDHIALSTSSPMSVHSPHLDNTPREAKLSDHALLGITLTSFGKVHNSRRRTPFPRFRRDKEREYVDRVTSLLGNSPPSNITFTNACMTAHMALASSPRYTKQTTPTTHKLHKTYKLLVAHQHQLESAFNHYTKPHPLIQGEPLWDREALSDRISQLKNTINNKARKRATLRVALFRKARSALYTSKRYGRFLHKALNRGTDFVGVVAVRTATGITTATADVIRYTTTRMQDTFFSWRQTIPPYFLRYEDTLWHTLPAWMQTVYARARHPSSEQWYSRVLSPISISDLRFCLKGCKNNKSGGPSGLTYEMVKALPDEVLTNHFLPLLNDILITGSISPTMKGFNIWALEKEANTGSILALEGKLNVRPISLFETSIKILERILCYRLWRVLLTHNLVDTSQFGFIPKGRVDDALLAYLFILEDVHQHKKPFHMGVNDFSKAYDSVPHWAMRLTYRYYRMPPPLIDLLLDLDKGRFGSVITGHGKGRTIPLSCGLGQGSPLAPLKWTLFLNPLLEWVNTAPDPYIITSPSGDIPISVVAFADDVTYFSSTNTGYRIRVSRGNEFAAFFGLTLNYKKSFYTYANTQRHYTSADVYSQETKSYTPSTVIPPGQPIRILGGWMSITMNWSKGKLMIQNNLLHYFEILKHKKLTTSELKYITRTVIASQALYYLNVTPLTDGELSTLDNKIALLWKRSIGTIPGASSPLCFTPLGSGFTSLLEARRSLLIRQAHRLLNSQGMVHDLAMARLHSLSTAWGYPICPLTMPFQTDVGYHQHWFARVHSALRSYNSTIPDVQRQLVLKPPPRLKDKPLAPLLPHHIFARLHNTLAGKSLYWLGDVLDVTGTKLAHRNTLHLSSRDWTLLAEALTGKNKLLHTTEALAHGPHMLPFEPCPHKIGDIVMVPGNPPTDRTNTTFHTVTDIVTERGHLLLTLKQWSTIHRPQRIARGKRAYRIRDIQGEVWAESHSTPLSTEFADACFTFPHTTVTVLEDSYVERWDDWLVQRTKAALIWDTDSFTSHHTTYTGLLTDDHVRNCFTTFTSRVQRKQDNLYWNADPPLESPNHSCVECSKPDATIECLTHLERMGCRGFAHSTCYILQHEHICTQCSSVHASAKPVHLDTPSHACSDGSYNPRTGSVACGFSATGNAPQSWNFAPSPHTPPSSYLAEIHGLALAYLATPLSTTHTHGFDNKALLPLHTSLWTAIKSNDLRPPWLTQTKYRASIRHLLRCIQTRGVPLVLRHVLSHMEHTHTKDPSLAILRDRLAEADDIASVAAEGYTQVPLVTPLPHCGDDFPILVDNTYSDDDVKALLDRLGSLQHSIRLSKYKMEGCLQRTVTQPLWKLPPLGPGVERYRLRYWLHRLPTFTELRRRGERLQNTCCRCHMAPECQTHCIVECHHNLPLHTQFRIKLLRTMRAHLNIFPANSTVRDVRPILVQRTIPHSIVEGWSVVTYDAHDRGKVLLKGEQLLKIEHTTHIPARALHILTHTHNTEDAWDAFHLPIPSYTVDFHLINIICTGFTLPFHCNPLPYHPFISSVQLDLVDLHTAHTGILLHAHDIPIFVQEQLNTLMLSTTKVCLITTQEDITLYNSGPPIVIAPDTLIVHTAGNWSGDTRPSSQTRNRDTIFCYYSNLSPSEVTLLTDIVRGRSMSGDKWTLFQPIHKYCPETDTPLWSYAEGTHPSRRHTTAFWGGGIDEEVMLALPIPFFTLQKCYRELIRRVLKEAHKRWRHRNTQLKQSGHIVDHDWVPRTHSPKAITTSPRKRKRDIHWTINRLTETRMQHIIHDYIHNPTQKPINNTHHSDINSGENSGGSSHTIGVSIREGEAETGGVEATGGFLPDLRGSSPAHGSGDGFLGLRGRGEVGTGEGPGEGESVLCRARVAVDHRVSTSGTSTAPPRTGKRRRQPDTQGDASRYFKRRRDKTTSHKTKRTTTAHDRHTDSTQPIQHTYCTTGQAHCTVVGMEIKQTNTE